MLNTVPICSHLGGSAGHQPSGIQVREPYRAEEPRQAGFNSLALQVRLLYLSFRDPGFLHTSNLTSHTVCRRKLFPLPKASISYKGVGKEWWGWAFRCPQTSRHNNAATLFRSPYSRIKVILWTATRVIRPPPSPYLRLNPSSTATSLSQKVPSQQLDGSGTLTEDDLCCVPQRPKSCL